MQHKTLYHTILNKNLNTFKLFIVPQLSILITFLFFNNLELLKAFLEVKSVPEFFFNLVSTDLTWIFLSFSCFLFSLSIYLQNLELSLVDTLADDLFKTYNSIEIESTFNRLKTMRSLYSYILVFSGIIIGGTALFSFIYFILMDFPSYATASGPQILSCLIMFLTLCNSFGREDDDDQKLNLNIILTSFILKGSKNLFKAYDERIVFLEELKKSQNIRKDNSPVFIKAIDEVMATIKQNNKYST